MRRIFIATPKHTLWRNQPGEEFSVGFHAHHCDLKIECLHGSMRNVSPGVRAGRGFKEWRWESPIRGESGRFTATGREFDVHSLGMLMRAGDEVRLRAQDLHTIFCPKARYAAWLVSEGREDPNYQPRCLTNADLQNWSPEGMYLPMVDRELRYWEGWLEEYCAGVEG